jgi:hypothetical protein
MAEEKKRFPWRLVVCAAVLVPVAAVLGFIETVGRQGTILGRSEEVKDGMSREQVHRILGTPSISHVDAEWFDGRVIVDTDDQWFDGPVSVDVEFWKNEVSHRTLLIRSDPDYDYADNYWNRGPVHHWGPYTRTHRVWWNIRRWAEQAYTAVHGPRR